MRRRLLTLAAAAWTFAAGGVALAQSPLEAECQGQDAERAVAACTEILKPGADRLPPPVAVPTLNWRGVAYVKQRDYDHAIADHTEAIKISPSNPRSYNLRGVAQRYKGDYDAAIADYTKAIEIDPQNTQFYNNRGYSYRLKNDYDAAIADFTQALRINSRSGLAYTHRALIYRLKLDFERAIADNNSAIQFFPREPRAYYARGATFEAQGDFTKALADYRQAQTLGGKSERLQQAMKRMEERLASGTPAATPGQTPATPNATSTQRPGQAASAGTPAAPTGGAEKRVALIIGNSKYANVPALSNPQRDAQALATSLQRIGFTTVTVRFDLPREKMLQELKAFAALADKADWAVVYYAGHGIEVGGSNYLVPIEAKLATDRDVLFEAVPLDQVLQTVEGVRKLGLVILDACRDNPFAKTIKKSGNASRSVGTGLANIEPEGATLVAYAARHGHTADEGAAGANSPYMTAMLKHIETPGLEINLLFRKIRDDVQAATSKRQEPFVYGSLPSEAFYFRKPQS